MLKRLDLKHIPQPPQSFKHDGVGVFQDRTSSLYHGFFCFVKTLWRSPALRERYAQGAGVSVLPFHRPLVFLPVNLGERRHSLSPLFQRGAI